MQRQVVFDIDTQESEFECDSLTISIKTGFLKNAWLHFLFSSVDRNKQKKWIYFCSHFSTRHLVRIWYVKTHARKKWHTFKGSTDKLLQPDFFKIVFLISFWIFGASVENCPQSTYELNPVARQDWWRRCRGYFDTTDSSFGFEVTQQNGENGQVLTKRALDI